MTHLASTSSDMHGYMPSLSPSVRPRAEVEHGDSRGVCGGQMHMKVYSGDIIVRKLHKW